MTNETSYKPVLSGDIAAMVGETCASWAGVNALTTHILAELMMGKSLTEDDELMFIVAITGMDMRTQTGLIRTLSVARFPPVAAKEIDSLLTKIESFKNHRDFYAHAYWSRNDEGKLIASSIKTIGKIKTVVKEPTKQSFNEQMAGLIAATTMLVHLLHEHGYLKQLTEEHGGKFF